MKDPLKTGHAERLSAQADAKKALLAKLKPKPTVQAEHFESRDEIRQRELETVRTKRAEEKEAARLAAEEREAADLDAKRAARKERKALTATEQKAKRDARYAARKSRQR